MKKLLLISASLVIASASFAQSDAGTDNSLYKFDNSGNPKEVRKLGTAPEFPFLRNMKSSHQVYEAIKKHEDDNSPAMNEMNDLLMQIGYTNGAKDLQPSDITVSGIQPGTEGNMGSRGYTYIYCRMEGSPSEFKAWKITAKNNSGTGPMYLFAKCGNAFYPKNGGTACISVPVNLTGNMSQVTLDNSGNTVTTHNEVFVYYNRRHHRRHETPNSIAEISDKYPSTPIMISSIKNVDVTPQTYNVTLSAPDNTVSACPGSTLDLTANINVEKVSSYTGNYPDNDHKTYQKVPKREYKMIARRMRRVDRKEDKIARRTHMKVDVSTETNRV